LATKGTFVTHSEDEVERLIRIVKDTASDHYLRRQAVQALGKLRDLRAVEPLIGTMLEYNKFAMEVVPETLGELGDRRAVEPLMKVLVDKKEMHDYRERAAIALGKVGDIRAVGSLINVLLADGPYIQAAAATALGMLGDMRAVDPLTMLRTKNQPMVGQGYDSPDVLEKAIAKALDKLGCSNAVDFLETEKDTTTTSQSRLQSLEKALRLSEQGAFAKAADVLQQSTDSRDQDAVTALTNLGRIAHGNPQHPLAQVQIALLKEHVEWAATLGSQVSGTTKQRRKSWKFWK
jgi:HEAT repeat protein